MSHIINSFWARVSASQEIVSSPVMLTVGKETVLSMNVTIGSGYNHTVFGKLVCDGQPVQGKPIEIRVNGTVEAVVTTQADRTYSVILSLKAVDNKATLYQVETAFYGDNALSLTGLATMPNGTSYAVCTTLHYFGYKPAANATMLTVEPQTTQTLKPEKTPEQVSIVSSNKN